MSAKRPAESSMLLTDNNKRHNSQSLATSSPTPNMLATESLTEKVNASYLAELEIAWRTVNAHPVFQGLPTLRTPPIGIQGFDIDKFDMDINTYGHYTCGGNIFWADLLYTGTSGVPINRRGARSQSSLLKSSWHIHTSTCGLHVSTRRLTTTRITFSALRFQASGSVSQ
jgi:hypothetical protein